MAVRKTFTRPPLPFIGNKWRWRTDFTAAVSGLPASTVFVDAFGGSGLLSRWCADAVPGATVVYNDYDGYASRVEQIPTTNAILSEWREILSVIPSGQRVPDGMKAQCLAVVERWRGLVGEVDERTLVCNVAFSSRSVERDRLDGLTWYSRIRQSDIGDASGYLDGLTVVREDFRALLSRYGDNPDAVFVLDPPYLSTMCDAYAAYGGLGDTLDLLAAMRGKRFIYFSSCRSEVDKVVAFVARLTGGAVDIFGGAVRREREVSLCTTEAAGSVKYTDLMYVTL